MASETQGLTPQQRFFQLVESGKPVQESDIEAVFNQLGPVDANAMLGEWTGGHVETGHPGVAQLKEKRWAGKNFYSVDDVEPVMVYDDNNNRVWLEEFGKARLREVVYRGVASTAMIYDAHPIIDHFRYVDEDTVVGAMDTKMFPKELGILYFYLKRNKAKTA